MECTVLRVPRLPSGYSMPANSQAPHRRRFGFWRSSVRGLGPPGPNHTPAGLRRSPRAVRRAESAASTRSQHVEAFARRVTRMNARTRCGLPIASRTASQHGAAARPIGVAAGVPSPIRASIPAVNVIRVDDTIERRDVSMTSRDDSGRLKTSWTSLPIHLQSPFAFAIGTSRPGCAGRFNGVLGRFTGLSKTSQNVHDDGRATYQRTTRCVGGV